MNRIAYILLLTFVFLTSPAYPQIIPIPYRAHNPSIPHPTYSGRVTIFKAVFRGSTCISQYRWDFNGDGLWDTDWLLPDINKNLEGTYNFSPVANKKIYLAEVELQGCEGESYFATYPVIVHPDIPSKEDANTASDDELMIMSEVAIDDALWFLNKNLYREGSYESASIRGYLWSNSFSSIPLYLMTLVRNGHFPAYPPGTYDDTGNSTPVSVQFFIDNDFRWAHDPYAENAARLLNYLLYNIALCDEAIPTADEADDGKTFIAGTNDGHGYCVNIDNGVFNPQSLSLEAIASARMGGTVAQLGILKNYNIEYIVQQLVDHAVHTQIHSGTDTGGWTYNPNEPDPLFGVSFISGGWISALIAAEHALGSLAVNVPFSVKDRLANWLVRNQASDGSALYYANGNSVFEPSGLSLLGCRWLGWDQWLTSDTSPAGSSYISLTKGQARQVFNKYYNYIVSKWTSSGTGYEAALWSDGNYDGTTYDHSYIGAIFNIKTGASYDGSPMINIFDSHNWSREFRIDHVKHQNANGTFNTDPGYLFANNLDTFVYTPQAVLTLTPALFDPNPVAVGSANPSTVLEGCATSTSGKVTFSHGDSFHLSPNRDIIDFQWLFDVPPEQANAAFNNYNWGTIANGGYSADGKAFHTNNRESPAVYTYNQRGTYYAALRILDNNNPAKSNIDVLTITVNTMPEEWPIVTAGGPYLISAGSALMLSGTATDPNLNCRYTETLTIGWYVNPNILILNQPYGEVPWANIANLPQNQPITIFIMATDSTPEVLGGPKTSSALTTLFISGGGFPLSDCDVDGSDLAALIANTSLMDIRTFAGNFGRNACQ
jgi:hypothetical protein